MYMGGGFKCFEYFLAPTIGKGVHLSGIICFFNTQPPRNGNLILGYDSSQSVGFHIETTGMLWVGRFFL